MSSKDLLQELDEKAVPIFIDKRENANGSWLITEIEVSFGSIIMGIYSQIINGSEIPNSKSQIPNKFK